jgi:hypothetical protein
VAGWTIRCDDTRALKILGKQMANPARETSARTISVGFMESRFCNPNAASEPKDEPYGAEFLSSACLDEEQMQRRRAAATALKASMFSRHVCFRFGLVADVTRRSLDNCEKRNIGLVWPL